MRDARTRGRYLSLRGSEIAAALNTRRTLLLTEGGGTYGRRHHALPVALRAFFRPRFKNKPENDVLFAGELDATRNEIVTSASIAIIPP
jgi:hypothetical protein